MANCFYLNKWKWQLCEKLFFISCKVQYSILMLSLLMSYIYGAPSKAKNLTSYIYIYMDEIFYWRFCFLNRAFR
jgi:hypothetical protein